MSKFTDYFKRLRQKRRSNRIAHQAHESDRKNYLLDEDTPFSVTEAFRNLKATLSVAMPKKEGGVSLLTTSTYPEEGKTTVAVNLAMMFAMSDVKVVLVDADIRKGRISKYFKQHHKPGLSDYLSGQATLDDVLHQSAQNPNLYIIYQGTRAPRPYELLESAAMKEFAEELRQKFDYVIYDTPPIRLVSDAFALLPETDGTLLVCRHMASYKDDIKTSLEALKFANANVLGIVVNDFYADPKKLTSGQKKYYHSYYYAYGYGKPKNGQGQNPANGK